MEPHTNLDRTLRSGTSRPSPPIFLNRAQPANQGSGSIPASIPASIPTVLQPQALSGTEGHHFQTALDQSMQSGAAVIVDLLWIKDIRSEGLDLLLAAMQQAQTAGASLLFQSMDQVTRNQLDDLWEQRRDMGTPNDLFAPDFENFLASFQSTKEATLRAFEMSSKTQW
jgi:anti-anti-sigma regulatory factor